MPFMPFHTAWSWCPLDVLNLFLLKTYLHFQTQFELQLLHSIHFSRPCRFNIFHMLNPIYISNLPVKLLYRRSQASLTFYIGDKMMLKIQWINSKHTPAGKTTSLQEGSCCIGQGNNLQRNPDTQPAWIRNQESNGWDTTKIQNNGWCE